jgi:hypothetical protein
VILSPRFGEDARDGELDVRLLAHAVAFDGVGQNAFVGGGVHAALDDVVVGAGANYFEGLHRIVNAGEDDDRGIFRGSDQALQAANAVGIRDGDVNQEDVEGILGDLQQRFGQACGGANGELGVASFAKLLANVGLVLSIGDDQENVPGSGIHDLKCPEMKQPCTKAPLSKILSIGGGHGKSLRKPLSE